MRVRVILARAWGCTPAQLRDCTLAELDAMADLLTDQHARQHAAVQARADDLMDRR